ncbi:vesicular glutamate transporter 1-like [Aphis craccivora]|uniref:Vesicular glutamate transporter 1-like n=1 Tax=Aphis craccivora TaxID=307492 RepID=A0A6G0Z6X2_APHCR|nr:vesicular glutamate transporter 1-like [Aphis craccivora]
MNVSYDCPNQQQYDEFEFANKSHLEKSSIPYTEDYSGSGEFGLQSPTESLASPVRPPLRHIDKYIKPEIPNISKRYTIAILTCVGFMISFGMRCNMSMAKLKFHIGSDVSKTLQDKSFNFKIIYSLNIILKLIEKLRIKSKIANAPGPRNDGDFFLDDTDAQNNITTTTVHTPLGNTPIHERPINWSLGSFVAIEMSFFCGYLITQVPGGFLASMYPANRVFGIAIAMSSCLNLLVPSATEIEKSFYVIVIRMFQGLVEGVTYPACHGIWRHWAPPLERSRLATIALCGSYAGVVVGMPLSGTLIDWFSWEAPFYVYGVLGLIWYVFWLWLCFEKPSLHPTISARELNYIESSLGAAKQSAAPTILNTPWKEFFTSMPVYAIIVANFCRSWNFYLLVLFQASYLHSFNFEVSATGYIGALPHLLMTIVVPLGGLLADHLRKNGILSTTAVRKIFNCGGFGMEATFFLVLANARTPLMATIALTCGVAFSGFAISGFNVNHLDIAPRYASILMGISNGIGTIAGLLCPIAINIIIRHKASFILYILVRIWNFYLGKMFLFYVIYIITSMMFSPGLVFQTRQSWSEVFILAAVIHYIGVIFYGIFASGELQSWAEPKVEEDQQMDEVNVDKKSKLSSYGSVEQSSGKGFVNAGLNTKSSAGDTEPAPPTDNPTNPFLAKPAVAATNPFVTSE